MRKQIRRRATNKKRDQYKQGTQAYVDANNELLAFQQETIKSKRTRKRFTII
jgi:hypothetical protein